jgi:phosphoglycerate dehydrogenase-like enzyme
MRILVAIPDHVRRDLFTADEWSRLAGIGELDALPSGSQWLPHDVNSRYDVVVSGWQTPPLDIASRERLGLVVHSAGGFRTVLRQSVFDAGIPVSQAGSDPMARAVAECAVALTLMILRELHSYDRAMQTSRDFDASRQPALSTSITGASHGLVGLSRTGQWHARLLRALGCTDLIAHDPYWESEAAASLGVRLVSLDEVMERDVVALHAPVTAETTGMIGREQIARMRDGAVLINTARSAIVDMDALTGELVSGRLRAGLDVFDEEPLPADSPLYGLPNVVLTPHVAGGTVQARHAMGRAVVDEIERFAQGKPLQFEVRPAEVARLS